MYDTHRMLRVGHVGIALLTANEDQRTDLVQTYDSASLTFYMTIYTEDKTAYRKTLYKREHLLSRQRYTYYSFVFFVLDCCLLALAVLAFTFLLHRPFIFFTIVLGQTYPFPFGIRRAQK